MVAFGVIGFLVLVLAYFVVKNQSLQKELNQIKYALKAVDAQSKYSLGALVMMSGQMQRNYLSRLADLQKHALISQDDYAVASFILNQVEFVVMQCCEHKSTIEEAIHKALETSEFGIEQINQYIAKQPSDIRVPWCKNTIGGFLSACHNLTANKKRSKSPDLEEQQAS